MRSTRKLNSGFGMIEILISLLILLIGLLGLAGLQALAQRSEMESYQRVQAIVLLQDMADRIKANRQASYCYGFTASGSQDTQFLGSSTSSVTPDPTTLTCGTGSATYESMALSDLSEWHQALLGASEKKGTTKLGAMIDARGCVVFTPDATTTDNSDGTYTITVTWQGINPTFAPASGTDCAKNTYGAENLRRAVSMVVMVPNLN
jgi:type IV pilus assembly protein PilV